MLLHTWRRQTTVTAYFTSEQLLLFVFARRSVCQYSMAEENPAVQRQTAVTVYFTGKQLLLFDFARRSVCQYSMSEENPAAQRQTAVTVYFTSKQLLLFAFAPQTNANSSNCLLYKWAVTAVCLCTAVSMSVLMAEENPAAQRQTAVTAYFTSKQLLLFAFAQQTSANSSNGLLSMLSLTAVYLHTARSVSTNLLFWADTYD